MCILDKLSFKISRGSMPPYIPSEARPYFCHANFDRELLLRTGNVILVSIMLRILITQKHFSFFTRKGCTFRIIHRYIFYGLLTQGPLKLKVHPLPPPKKLRTLFESMCHVNHEFTQMSF